MQERREFAIDGEIYNLKVDWIRFGSIIVEVTACMDQWARYIPGRKYVEILGVTEDEEIIDARYDFLGISDDGLYMLGGEE